MIRLTEGVIDESDLRLEQMRLIRIQIEFWETRNDMQKEISELDTCFARQRLKNAELEFEISKVIHEIHNQIHAERQRKPEEIESSNQFEVYKNFIHRISEKHD